jgi:PhnB protein
MFWGDRFGKVADPYGHHWGIVTHKEDLSPEEMGKRAQAFFASMGGGEAPTDG